MLKIQGAMVARTAWTAGAGLLLASIASAGVSLPVTKSPVASGGSPQTGPSSDLFALQGQWFKSTGTGGRSGESPRSHEFYDNPLGHGGGSTGSNALRGTWDGWTINSQNRVNGFWLKVSITNDTDSVTGMWTEGSNFASEFRVDAQPYSGKMFDTVLTLEWVDDGVQGNWQGGGSESIFFASQPDALASITKNSTQSWSVPAWDFGDIAPGETVTRRIHIGMYTTFVPSVLLPPSPDVDLLMARSTGLKISDYFTKAPNVLNAFGGIPGGQDTGTPYPFAEYSAGGINPFPMHSSNASVFHNIPAPGSFALAGITGLALFRRRRSA